VILVADSSKFGRIAFTSIAPLSVVSRLITDQEADTEVVTRLRRQNIEVVLA